ncbi:MAG: DUF2220 domain-containing protein [Candidatus Saccharibacteria bacterium]|nr:DUF2220 domain-containing protein [Candidatus Saccharibacteria bacterium]
MKKKLLNKLIDKYEASKSFMGQNKVHQTFSVNPVKLFSEYQDDAEVAFFSELNGALSDLEKAGFVTILWGSGNVAESVSLNVESIDAIYSFLGRSSRKQIQTWLEKTLNAFSKDACSLLQNYINHQKIRINENKNVEFFNFNELDFEDLLRSVNFIQANSDEILIRNASLALFKDSKRLENIQTTVETLMREYGDYEGCDDIFAECNVVKTPTQVLVKGNACIQIGSQMIDLSLMRGDIGFSTKSLNDISSVKVLGARVVTIENLTSFYTYESLDDFVIYLGGFHNSVKRQFIKQVAQNNPQKQYLHFGDIDAGGFYILKHLRNKTGINFLPMFMDVGTLVRYQDKTKKLTDNDRNRLLKLKEQGGFDTVIDYMLKNDCKLEQENILTGV